MANIYDDNFMYPFPGDDLKQQTKLEKAYLQNESNKHNQRDSKKKVGRRTFKNFTVQYVDKMDNGC